MRTLPLFCLFISLVAVIFSNCAIKNSHQDTEALLFTQEIERWQQQREKNLRSPTGWLTVVGLHLLKEGENTFGAAATNQHRFTNSAPTELGVFYKKGDSISIKILHDHLVTQGGQSISDMTLIPAPNDKTVLLNHTSLTWFVIKRGDNYYVRVKDTESEARKNFTSLDYYPINQNWKVSAKLIPYTSGKTTTIENVLGIKTEEKVVGQLRFKIKGKTHTLDALSGGDNSYFIIFADETTGEETYGGGRFIYVPKVDENNQTFIDFNRAYSPPCVFTDYATCPLPPQQNFLEVAIEAGEKGILSFE